MATPVDEGDHRTLAGSHHFGRRDELVGYLADRADQRAHAAAELADLEPEIAAARAAWEPYRTAIAAIEDELRNQLRPAMWEADHDAMHARFGHHHSSRRRANGANQRVADAEAAIAAVYAGAADVKQRLDTVQAEAWNLHDLAHPSPAGLGLEELKRHQLHDTERLVDAIGVWATWAHGQPVALTHLIEAAETLTETAHGAPPLAVNAGEIDRSQWIELLAPVTESLQQHRVRLPSRELEPGHTGPELSIEL